MRNFLYYFVLVFAVVIIGLSIAAAIAESRSWSKIKEEHHCELTGSKSSVYQPRVVMIGKTPSVVPYWYTQHEYKCDDRIVWR